MRISRRLYRLCLLVTWTPVGVCVTGMVLTGAKNPDWVVLLTAGLMVAIPAQLFAAAVRLKTLGGRYQDVIVLLHIIGGPLLLFRLLFDDDEPAATAEKRSPPREDRARSPASQAQGFPEKRPDRVRSGAERPTAAGWAEAASDQISKL